MPKKRPHSIVLRALAVMAVGATALATLAAGQDAATPRPKKEVQALLDQAKTLAESGKLDEAAARLSESASKATKLNDPAGQAASLRDLADVQAKLGKDEEAFSNWNQARILFAKVKDRASEAGVLAKIGAQRSARGEAEKAVTALRQALAIQKEIGDRNGEGETHLGIAMALQDSDPRSALESATRAKEAFADEKNGPWTSVSLIVCGDLFAGLGRHREALQAYVDSANLCHGLGLKALEGESLAKLGQEYENAGQYSAAIGYYGQALAIAKESNDLRKQAARLMSLGIVSDSIGQYGSAQDSFQQAASIYKSLDDQLLYASAIQNLGVALHESGNDNEAVKRLEEALALNRSRKNAIGEAGCLGTLGNIARKAKDYGLARTRLTSAVEIFRREKDRSDEATALDTLGSVSFDEGDYPTAVSRFDEAIAIYSALKADSFAATSYGNKAEALFLAKRLEDSGSAYREAVGRFELIRTNLGQLTDAKSSYLSKRVHVYRQYANVLTLLGRPDEAFDVVQKMKARGLLDLMAAGGVVADTGMTAEERKTERELRETADSLNARMLQEGVQNQVGSKARYEALKKDLSGAEQKLSEFTTRLFARLPDLRAKRMAETATTVECGRLLPDDTALIEYAVCDYGVVSVVLRKVDGVLTVNGHSRAIDVEDLERKCSALRKACSTPDGDYSELAADLYQVLIAPLEKDIAGKQRLVLCPDACLWDLPFAVLAQTPGKFLIDGQEIDYAFSATGAMASLTGQGASKAPKSLLVCANPVFGPSTRFKDLAHANDQRPIDTPSRPIDQPSRPIDQPSRPIDQPSRPIDQPSRPIDQPSRAIDSVSRAIDSLSRESGASDGSIRPLPGTQREADGLSGLVAGATVLTGAAAQEGRVKEEAKEYRYLHFATHGFMNDASPLLSNVILAQPAKGDKDDGFLTAREIYGLQLQAEMVVLSACNTARGEIRSGEGIVGLTWALFVAGCRSQVVSQWSVDDACTADMMVDFYRRLTVGHAPKGTALTEAARKIRRDPKRAHPYYWAPFVLVGDWH